MTDPLPIEIEDLGQEGEVLQYVADLIARTLDEALQELNKLAEEMSPEAQQALGAAEVGVDIGFYG